MYLVKVNKMVQNSVETVIHRKILIQYLLKKSPLFLTRSQSVNFILEAISELDLDIPTDRINEDNIILWIRVLKANFFTNCSKLSTEYRFSISTNSVSIHPLPFIIDKSTFTGFENPEIESDIYNLLLLLLYNQSDLLIGMLRSYFNKIKYISQGSDDLILCFYRITEPTAISRHSRILRVHPIYEGESILYFRQRVHEFNRQLYNLCLKYEANFLFSLALPEKAKGRALTLSIFNSHQELLDYLES